MGAAEPPGLPRHVDRLGSVQRRHVEHTVADGWLMTTLALSPLLMALVQTATTLPAFLLALPAGALADSVNRRRWSLFSQSWLLAAAAVLGVMALMGAIGPWTLLGLTFALGIGSGLNGPACTR